jgi:hypothetical protein
VDVTEIFRQLSGQKRTRLIKLGYHLVFFIVVIYKLVVCAATAMKHIDHKFIDVHTLGKTSLPF